MCHLAHSFFCFIGHFEWYYYRSLRCKPLFSFKLLRDQHVLLSLEILHVITIRTIGVHHPHHWCWVSARWYDMIKRVIVVYPLWRENITFVIWIVPRYLHRLWAYQKQLLKRRARGFVNTENFKYMVYFMTGELKLNYPHDSL